MENESDNDECYNLNIMFDKVEILFKKSCYSYANDGWNFFLSRKLDIKSTNWRDRYNYIITLYYISEFNNKELNNNFNSIIEILISIIKSRQEDYRVLYVVFNFINEFLQEEEEEGNERVKVVIGYSTDIISNVLSLIGSNKQVDKSAFQLINSISKFDEIDSIVFQYRDQILTKVLQSLHTFGNTIEDNYCVNVISTIFSKFTDDKYKSGNINYYNVIIPVLLNILKICYNQSNIKDGGYEDLMDDRDDNDDDEYEDIDYFYKVLEAISFLVISVEPIISSGQCRDIIKLILSLPIFNVAYNRSISITLRSLFRFIQSIDYSETNKDIDFMPLVISRIMFLINDNYTLNSLLDKMILKNIKTAIDMIAQLVPSNLISPYIEQLYIVLVESMINFNPFHKSGIEIEIKSTLLIKSIVINNIHNNSLLISETFQKIGHSIGIDKKPSTISIKLHTLSELLKLTPDKTTTTPDELIIQIISNSFNSIQQIEKNNKDGLKGIRINYNSNEEDITSSQSDNGDYIDQINEIEESYDQLTNFIQIISTIDNQILIDQLVGSFLIQVLNFIKKSNNVNIKSNMICVLDYFLENCSGIGIFRNYSKIIELLIDCFINSSTSASTFKITQPSVYGIGIVAEKSGTLFKPYQDSIFNSLKQFIQYSSSVEMSNSRDNSISAIGKIIRFQLNESTITSASENSITIIQDYLNTFINSLPIQSDFDELPSILETIFFILVTYSKLLSKDNINKLFNTIEICGNMNIQLEKHKQDILSQQYK